MMRKAKAVMIGVETNLFLDGPSDARGSDELISKQSDFLIPQSGTF